MTDKPKRKKISNKILPTIDNEIIRALISSIINPKLKIYVADFIFLLTKTHAILEKN